MPLGYCVRPLYIATLMRTERIIYFSAQYTSPALPEATPSWQRRKPAREKQRVNSKRKRRLTDRQERRRIEGLRILARIIARHYLANPHLYANGSSPANGRVTADGEAVREEGEA